MKNRTRNYLIEGAIVLVVLIVALWFMVPKFAQSQFPSSLKPILKSYVVQDQPTITASLSMFQTAPTNIHMQHGDAKNYLGMIPNEYSFQRETYFWRTSQIAYTPDDTSAIEIPTTTWIMHTNYYGHNNIIHRISAVYIDPESRMRSAIEQQGIFADLILDDKGYYDTRPLVPLYDNTNGLFSEGLIYVDSTDVQPRIMPRFIRDHLRKTGAQ